MEKTAEMTLAEALSSIDSTQEKLAISFRDMKIEELEELLSKEAGVSLKKKSEMVKMSAEEKFLMADQWGRELAREFAKTAAKPIPGFMDVAKHYGKKALEKLPKGAQEAVKATGSHLSRNRGKYLGGGGYLYGVHRGRKVGGEYYDEATDSYKPKLPIEDQYLPKEKKSQLEKDALSVPPGVSGMLAKAAPTISKGLQSAGKALGGTSMKGRAIAGGAIGALGGAMKSPGVDPATGQQKSRLTGALAGAGVGAAGGAMAPKMVSGAQGLMGKLAK